MRSKQQWNVKGGWKRREEGGGQKVGRACYRCYIWCLERDQNGICNIRSLVTCRPTGTKLFKQPARCKKISGIKHGNVQLGQAEHSSFCQMLHKIFHLLIYLNLYYNFNTNCLIFSSSVNKWVASYDTYSTTPCMFSWKLASLSWCLWVNELGGIQHSTLAITPAMRGLQLSKQNGPPTMCCSGKWSPDPLP